MLFWQRKKKKKKQLSSFVINSYPRAINCRLVCLAKNREGGNGLKLKNVRLTFSKFSFLFPKCARTHHELFRPFKNLVDSFPLSPGR